MAVVSLERASLKRQLAAHLHHFKFNLPERRNFYGTLESSEKEFLIRQFKLSDFYTLNHMSDAAFRKWLKQYEEGGLEGLPMQSLRMFFLKA